MRRAAYELIASGAESDQFDEFENEHGICLLRSSKRTRDAAFDSMVPVAHYFPRRLPTEVELLFASLASVNNDQLAVWARMTRAGIRYRLVTDSGDEFDIEIPQTGRPLSLRELLEALVPHGWEHSIHLHGKPEERHPDAGAEMLVFLQVYPEVERYIE